MRSILYPVTLAVVGACGVSTVDVGDGSLPFDAASHDGSALDGAMRDGAMRDGAMRDGSTLDGSRPPDGGSIDAASTDGSEPDAGPIEATCVPTDVVHCIETGGRSARCYPDGHVVVCPRDLPRCWPLDSGDATCVLDASEPCDPNTHGTRCASDSRVSCYRLADGTGVTWPVECASAPLCANPDTADIDVPGPCHCVDVPGAMPAAVCAPSPSTSCTGSFSRSCDGNTLHYCGPLGIAADHECPAEAGCTETGGSAGCAVSGPTACSGTVAACISDTIAQPCCDPLEDARCLPGYETALDCVERYGPDATCDSFWHHCGL